MVQFERKGQDNSREQRAEGREQNIIIVEDNIVLDPSPPAPCPKPSARTFP